MDLRDLLKAFYYIRDWGNASSSEEMVTNTVISPEMAQSSVFLLSHRCINIILGVQNMKY